MPNDANAQEEALFQRILSRLQAAGGAAARGTTAAGHAAASAAQAAGGAAINRGGRVAGAVVGAVTAGAAFATETAHDALNGVRDAQIFFRVPSSLRTNIKLLAAEEGRNMDELLREALVDLLVRKGRLLPAPEKDPEA